MKNNFLLELENIAQRFASEKFINASLHFDPKFLYKEAGNFINYHYNGSELRVFDIIVIIAGDLIKYGRLGELTKLEAEMQKLTLLLSYNNYDDVFYSLINAYAYPAKAYYAYKKLDYKAAVDNTLWAINEIHKIQDKIPVFYAMKIEQIRNILRIDFKIGNKEDACFGYIDLIQHLCDRDSANKQFKLTSVARDSISVSIQQILFEELFLDCAYNLLTFCWTDIYKIFNIIFKNIPNQINSEVNFSDSLLWIKAIEEILYTTDVYSENYGNTIAFIYKPIKKLNGLKFVLLCMILMKNKSNGDKPQTNEFNAGIIKFISDHFSSEHNNAILASIICK